jgi:hypothetical protein
MHVYSATLKLTLFMVTSVFQLNSDESWLGFDQEAKVLHNKVSL